MVLASSARVVAPAMEWGWWRGFPLPQRDVRDLIMTFIDDSEYALQLPATLPHLHKMPPGLILPWFQNERDRIVALIAPEEGKSAATILGVSLTRVRR